MGQAGAHRLGIGRMQTVLRAGPGQAADWARLMQAMAQGPLGTALGAQIEDIFSGDQAVIRIDRLRLDWTLAAPPGFSAADLAQALARQIARRLAEALRAGGTDGLRIWPDPPAYLAAQVRSRLGIDPLPPWAGPEFSALDHLTGAEAAELLLSSSDPAIWPRLAADAPQAQQILARLGPAALLRLLPPLMARGRPGPAALNAALTLWRHDPPPPAALGLAGAVIWHLILPRNAGADAADVQPPDLALALCAILSLHQARQMPAPGESPAWFAAVQDASDLPADLSPLHRAALTPWAARPELWSRLLLETRPISAPVAAAPALANPGLPPARPTPAPDLPVQSAFAGLAPLIALCPWPNAAPEALRQIALHLLPEPDQADLALDPGFALLFPADPRHSPPPLPAPDPQSWAGLDAGALAGAPPRPGAAGLADLWLARFAARLPGLHASSRAYLARQFLHRPGRLIPEPALIHIHLPAFPLAIVLRMSGLLDPTRPIPHLDRRRLSFTLDP